MYEQYVNKRVEVIYDTGKFSAVARGMLQDVDKDEQTITVLQETKKNAPVTIQWRHVYSCEELL